ncbi:MAG: hypothetical protein ACKE5M_00075 [Methylophilaceae bacterium]
MTNADAAGNIATLESADELQACAHASFEVGTGKTIFFWQHLFEGGVRDLALAEALTTKPSISKHHIKRVTYLKHQNQTCPYQALAITEGVGWGWHLAWADSEILYIVRLDGEAWVSSIPKKVVVDHIDALQFIQNTGSLSIQWKTVEGETVQMQSEDDGRSWLPPAIDKD